MLIYVPRLLRFSMSPHSLHELRPMHRQLGRQRVGTVGRVSTGRTSRAGGSADGYMCLHLFCTYMYIHRLYLYMYMYDICFVCTSFRGGARSGGVLLAFCGVCPAEEDTWSFVALAASCSELLLGRTEVVRLVAEVFVVLGVSVACGCLLPALFGRPAGAEERS